MDSTRKSFIRLIVPFFTIFLLFSIYLFISCRQTESTIKDFIVERLYTLLYSSGSNIRNNDMIVVERIGAIWFLLVLFISKSLFGLFQLKSEEITLAIFSFIVLILGVVIGKIIWLPLSLDIAMVSFFYLWFGWKQKKHVHDALCPKKMAAFLFAWAFSFIICWYFSRSYLELSQRRYPVFPLCIICSIFGSLFVFEASKAFCRIKKARSIFCFIGENSLYLLCIHSLDDIWITPLKSVVHNQIACFMSRLLIDLFLLYLFVFVKKSFNTNIQSSLNSKS